MLNKAILVGRMVRTPELKATASGVDVTKFCIAIQRRFKDATGERPSDFINCVSFRKTAEFVANYCDKGDMVAVDGTIQTRSYDDQEGRRVYVTEVIAEAVNKIMGEKRESKTTEPEVDDGGTDIGVMDFGPTPDDDDLPF